MPNALHSGDAAVLDRYPQMFLDMFSKHETKVWAEDEMRRIDQAEKRRANTKPQTIRVFQNTNNAQFLLQLESLDLTDRLVGDKEHELDTQTCPLAETPEDSESALEPQTSVHRPIRALRQEGLVSESEYTWTQAAVEELHETVLHYSLNVLQAKGNSQEKKEVLQWIFAPETYKALVTNEETGFTSWVTLPQEKTPFSFEQCCRICGYSSERLMRELEPILIKLKLQRL